ncbi:hypothetical protein [Enterococcus faecalis]|uniref:hypothetical protein n=1 Tax=Enterococcus faecalis TaxID=1351 RepID=UPI004042CA43
MFKYKVVFNFKEKYTCVSQKLNVPNPGKYSNKIAWVEHVSINSNGIEMYFNADNKIVDFNEFHKIVNRFKSYLIGILDCDILLSKDKYDMNMYLLEDNNWCKLNFALITKMTGINYKTVLTEKNAVRLLEYIYGECEIPLSTILLKKSKVIADERQRFISIMTACEIGVKEFYLEAIPELGVILDNLQAPPITKLLGSIFYEYFNVEFPKELRKSIHKFVERRNLLVHSLGRDSPSGEECFECYVTVLKTLNFFNKFLNNGFYNELYDEKVELISRGGNESQFILSDFLKEQISLGKTDVSFQVTISNDYRKEMSNKNV